MTPNLTEKKLRNLQLIAVVVGVALLLGKFLAYFFTHSNTILTDALESIVNVLAGCFALYSLYLSAKPKDSGHPYGHGKVEFLSVGSEGIFIALAGIAIIGKSIYSFFRPEELTNLTIGLGIIVATGLLNYLVGSWQVYMGAKYGSLVLQADGQHLKSDAYSSLAILLGIGLILLTGWSLLDNIIALLIGIFFIYTGLRIFRKALAGIMDEADEKIIQAIVELLNQYRRPAWIDIHHLRVVQYGNKWHIDCHITMPWYYTVAEAHRELDCLRKVIEERYPLRAELSMHVDPCLPPEACGICLIHDCPVRKAPFREQVVWTAENVSRNKRHIFTTDEPPTI